MTTRHKLERAIRLLRGYQEFSKAAEQSAWSDYEDLMSRDRHDPLFNASNNPDSEYYTGPSGTLVDDPKTEGINEGWSMASGVIRQRMIEEVAARYGNWYIPRRAIANALNELESALAELGGGDDD